MIASESNLIRSFVVASNALEQHLRHDGPLTPLQRQTIASALASLLILFQRWMYEHPKHRIEHYGASPPAAKDVCRGT
jgi:hypothetical protein